MLVFVGMITDWISVSCGVSRIILVWIVAFILCQQISNSIILPVLGFYCLNNLILCISQLIYNLVIDELMKKSNTYCVLLKIQLILALLKQAKLSNACVSIYFVVLGKKANLTKTINYCSRDLLEQTRKTILWLEWREITRKLLSILAMDGFRNVIFTNFYNHQSPHTKITRQTIKSENWG